MTTSDGDWVSVGEYDSYPSAKIVSQVLSAAEIPHRIVRSALPIHDFTCWIWVPPEAVTEAKRVLAECTVSDKELTAEALSYPRPDDA